MLNNHNDSDLRQSSSMSRLNISTQRYHICSSYLESLYEIIRCNNWFLPSTGHKGNRRRLSPSSSDGLSTRAASANARLLAERQSRAAQIWPDSQHPWQDDPQSQHVENASGNMYEVSKECWTQLVLTRASGKEVKYFTAVQDVTEDLISVAHRRLSRHRSIL